MNYDAGIITVSDRSAQGLRPDGSGPALRRFLEENGFSVKYMEIVPDEEDIIAKSLIHAADELKLPLILTTGGTGFSPRDVTPEATRSVIEREVPGIPELMRAESMKITPKGCLSRSVAGIRGLSLIVNLPGSPKAAVENISPVIAPVIHGLDTLRADGPVSCGEGGAANE